MSGIAAKLAVLPTLVWTGQLIAAKKASAESDTLLSSIYITGMAIIPILIYALLSYKGLTPYQLGLSALSGVFFFLASLLTYKSTETEQISNTTATGLVQPILVVAFSIIALHEGISALQALSGGVIIAGVLMVITLDGLRINARLLPALGGNVLYAAYWMAASTAIVGSGSVAVPLLVSRIISFAGLAVVAIFIGRRLRRRKGAKAMLKARIAGTVSGLLDGAGDMLFGLMAFLGVLALASLFTVILPILVTGVAYFLYRERLNKVQWIGMAIAIAGAFALAVI